MGEQSVPPSENGFTEKEQVNGDVEMNSEEEDSDTFEDDMTTEGKGYRDH